MSKFPILNLYRRLFNLGAVLVLLVGVITIISDFSAGGGFDLAVFAASFIPFVAVSVGLAFLAEIIKLALAIEKHLERIANK